MTDLTLAQASSLATEVSLSKNYATTAINISTNNSTDVQDIKITQNEIKKNFDLLLDLLKTANISGISDSSLNDLTLNI